MDRACPMGWGLLAASLLATAAPAQGPGDRPQAGAARPGAGPGGRKLMVVMEGDAHRLGLTIADPADGPTSADPGREDEGPPPPVEAVGRKIFLEEMAIVGPENFDLWFFGRPISPFSASIRLGEKLDAKLREAVAEHRLTDAQRAKLELAGRGDIKHLLDRIEEKREAFERARGNLAGARRILKQLAPLSAEYDLGPFQLGSLFDKTLRTIRDGPSASAPGPSPEGGGR